MRGRVGYVFNTFQNMVYPATVKKIGLLGKELKNRTTLLEEMKLHTLCLGQTKGVMKLYLELQYFSNTIS